MDGPLHAALHRGPEGLPPFLQQLHVQAVPPLPDDRSGGGPGLDSRPPVGCQAVFPSPVDNRADAARKAPQGQGDSGHRQHQASALRARPRALGPQVGAGKGPPPVRLHISRAAREVQPLSVEDQASLQGMPHAEDAVGALHPREKPKGPHDILPDGGEGPIPQLPLERKPVLADIHFHAPAAEPGLPQPDLEAAFLCLERRLRVFQPPRSIFRQHLKRGSAAPSGVRVERRNQRQGLPFPALVL